MARNLLEVILLTPVEHFRSQNGLNLYVSNDSFLEVFQKIKNHVCKVAVALAIEAYTPNNEPCLVLDGHIEFLFVSIVRVNNQFISTECQSMLTGAVLSAEFLELMDKPLNELFREHSRMPDRAFLLTLIKV